MTDILKVRDLHTHFVSRNAVNEIRVARALNGVDLTLPRGRILGIVGETGAGKSLTVQTILGLLKPPARRVGGEIELDGRRLDGLPEKELNRLRGSSIGLVVQSPVTSLDPRAKVGEQIVRLQRAHRQVSRGEAWKRGVIIVTHDLGVVAQYCADVAVMYSGTVVEQGPVAEVFVEPRHPYTQALIRAADLAAAAGGRRALPPSTPPDLYDLPEGCLFAPRCPKAEAVCSTPPPVVERGSGPVLVRCHFA